jgi:hypothetical protein
MDNTILEEKIAISGIISDLNQLMNRTVLHMYRVTLTDEEHDTQYRCIIISDTPSAEIPDHNEDHEFIGNAVLVWGHPVASNTEIPNIEYIAKMTCMSLATVLTLSGVEVFLQNRLFAPERGID